MRDARPGELDASCSPSLMTWTKKQMVQSEMMGPSRLPEIAGPFQAAQLTASTPHETYSFTEKPNLVKTHVE